MTTAQALQAVVAALLATPSAETHAAAKAARMAARVPYQQTEAFRFGNPIVADCEGRVNAWPCNGPTGERPGWPFWPTPGLAFRRL